MSHLLMGALNKHTNQYEYPRIAKKENKYICPDCNKDVILRKGTVRVHHFAHFKDENPCTYYNKPTESQIHKDGKKLMKTLLENKRMMCFNRICNKCSCCNDMFYIKEYSDTISINEEFRFQYDNSNKVADVAYLDNNEIKYIFEICYKHKTKEGDRPEPWFEIDASNLIRDVNNENSIDIININCIRNKTCEKCILAENFRKRLLLEEQERQRQLMAEKEKKRLEEEERQRQLVAEKEKKRLEEQRIQQRIQQIKREKGSEILKRIRSEQKKCSKCKSFERCMKCVDKIFKRYNDEINILDLNS